MLSPNFEKKLNPRSKLKLSKCPNVKGKEMLLFTLKNNIFHRTAHVSMTQKKNELFDEIIL
jgi:hypothetical protein